MPTEARAALEALEWMLTRRSETDARTRVVGQPYGDPTKLNTERTILDAVGEELLGDIVGDYLDLLETSSAVYEKNGDYAFGIFSSGWCRAMDVASFRASGKSDLAEALGSGRWHCHESCWNEASRPSIVGGEPIDVACAGGIRLYAVPIRADNEIVGSINFGYGAPPTGDELLKELSTKYRLPIAELQRNARTYRTRPAFIIELAKRRLHVSARLIGEIVQRKRAQERLARANATLQASERRFRALLENSADAVVLFGVDGTAQYSTPSTMRLLGYEPAELTGRSAIDFVHPDDRELVGRVMTACAASSEPMTASARVRHRNGSYVELEGSLTNLLSDPAVGAIVVNYRDVTERNRTARDLAQSEAQFRAYMAHTPMLACCKDAAGRMVYVNPAWSRWFGPDRDVIGRTDDELWPAPVARRMREEAERVLETREARESTEELAGHDGVLRRWQLVRFPIVRDDGETHVGVMALDVTERARVRAVLDAAQERLRHAIVAGNVGLWDWDLTTNEVYYSPEWKAQIGYEVGEIGTSFREWESRVHPDDLDDAVAAVQAYVAGSASSYEVEFRFRHKSGSYRRILARGTKVLGPGGVPTRMLGSHVDITARTELRAQFLHAQKMESIGLLAGGIAHDFNNMIMVINTTAELVAASLPENDALQADLQEIRRAGDRSAALTRQLLAFSRKQIMAPVALELGSLVEGLRSMLRRVIGEHIALVVSVGDRATVTADPGQLEQVIVNLVVNARDAMPDGGTLRIDTREVVLDDAFASEHPGAASGAHVRLTVTDTGTGMDEATLARIFEPFFTTKATGRGTGLGLATTHGIVAQSGGTILARSEVGKGTSFEIHLPCVSAASETRERADPTPPALGRGTILLVEDEGAIRRLATRILERVGYEVLVAGHGDEALRLVENHDGVVDLLLTDVVMPGMSGRELADRLRALRPKVRTLYTSGYTDDEIVRHGVLDDPRHFLAKPYSAADLTAKVRDILKGTSVA